MGKGKGTPQKWVYKPLLSKPFAVVSHYEYKRAKKIALYFKKYLCKYIFVQSKLF